MMIDAGPSKCIEEVRFSCVGVADQCDRGYWRGFAALPLLGSNFANIFQLLFDVANPTGNFSTVGLELSFSRAASTDSAAELGHFHAPACEPWQHVLQLGKFDLQLAFAGFRVPRKNIENELRAVNDAPLDDPFDIALLRRAEVVIEQKHIGVNGSRCAGDLFKFAGADESGRVWSIAALKEFTDDFRSGAFR